MHEDIRKGSRTLVATVLLSLMIIVGGLVYHHGGFGENAQADGGALTE